MSSGQAWSSLAESVARCVSDVRQALGDTRQELIRTVPRRGYVLVASSAFRSPTTGQEGSPTSVSSASGRPSIAVLRFANLNGDTGQDYLADGMAQEIITALSGIGWIASLLAVLVSRAKATPRKWPR